MLEQPQDKSVRPSSNIKPPICPICDLRHNKQGLEYCLAALVVENNELRARLTEAYSSQGVKR